MRQTVLVIGGGVGGLSAGIYALENGYDVDIFEMHSGAGGLCTAWRRDGYVCDGCIHYLIGSVSGPTLHEFWNELGVFGGIRVRSDTEYLTVKDRGGRIFTLYKDARRLREHLARLSPADAAATGALCDDIAGLSRMPTSTYRFPVELLGTPEAREALRETAPFVQLVRSLSGVSLGQAFRGIRDKLIRDGFHHVMPEPCSLFALVWTLACFHNGDGNWYPGGSAALSRALLKRFTERGGRIHYNAKAAGLLAAGDRVTAIRLEDGTEIPGHHVIAAIDGHTVLTKLVDPRFSSLVLRDCYRRFEPISAIAQVSLGINADLAGYPRHLCVELDEPLDIAGGRVRHFVFRHYCEDAAMAPAGKSVITSLLLTPYSFWEPMRDEPGRYREEKERLARAVRDVVLREYQLPPNAIEMVDVATPLTYFNKTGVWRGAYNGWLHTPESALVTIPKMLPGLRNFYFAGQWVAPGGGLPLAACSGRWAVQLLQAMNGIQFYAPYKGG